MNTANLTFEQGVMTGAGIIAIFLVILLLLKPWRRAFFSGAHVPLSYIIGIRLRGNSPDFLIEAYIELVKGGISIPLGHIECIYIQNKYTIKTPHDLAKMALTFHENQQNESQTSGMKSG